MRLYSSYGLLGDSVKQVPNKEFNSLFLKKDDKTLDL
jgi:hypothetical protein